MNKMIIRDHATRTEYLKTVINYNKDRIQHYGYLCSLYPETKFFKRVKMYHLKRCMSMEHRLREHLK